MSERKLLNSQEISSIFEQLNWPLPGQWVIESNFLVYQHTFTDFTNAFSFLTKVALVSEKLDHHATIENTYNKVTLKLSTHDANGITELDFKWIKLLSIC